METLKLAWRNLWRNSRRTLVTMGATAFGLFTMIVYTGLVGGYLSGLERQIVVWRIGGGHVRSSGTRCRPSASERCE